MNAVNVNRRDAHAAAQAAFRKADP